MVYDPSTGNVILFGGFNDVGGDLSDTWTYGYPSGIALSTTTTTPATSSIMLGSSDTDNAVVTGNAGAGSPTGSVTFYECGPSVFPESCTSQDNQVGSGVGVTSGANDTSSAASASFTPTSTGYWCFAGDYSGDSNYGSSSDTSTDECVDVYQQLPPLVSGVFPDTGVTTAGTTVTVTGSSLAGVTAVYFGSTPGTGLNLASNDKSLTVVSPQGSPGTVDVTVVTANGTSPVTPADEFNYTFDQSSTVVPCSSCSVTVSNPDPATITASGSSGNSSGTLSLVVNTGVLSCGASYDYEAPISTLSTSGFNHGKDLTVVDTVGDTPSTSGVHLCYTVGSSGRPRFLGLCNISLSNAPCLESLVESDDSVTATFLSPAQDPRFWCGGAAPVLKTFSPTKGKPGNKVVIKGKNLNEVGVVVIGGAQATIDSESSTALTVNVSANALAEVGQITVTAASGDTVSKKNFSVI